MRPTILYRASRECMGIEELGAAQAHFATTTSRLDISRDTLVIGRYSVLPFYRELEDDIRELGGRLINTHSQHLYVADLQNWVADLGDLTPSTWAALEDIPDDGSFVLKGATNSKKFNWKTHMYAATRKDAFDVYDRLMDDGLISQQQIYIRRFVPLVTYYEDIIGLPVTREFRFFVYDGEILCGGYYWANHAPELEERVKAEELDPANVPRPFLEQVMRKIGRKVMFYALDVAQTAAGDWIVIELNDGQMSGLSTNDPKLLYSRLRERVR